MSNPVKYAYLVTTFPPGPRVRIRVSRIFTNGRNVERAAQIYARTDALGSKVEVRRMPYYASNRGRGWDAPTFRSLAEEWRVWINGERTV